MYIYITHIIYRILFYLTFISIAQNIFFFNAPQNLFNKKSIELSSENYFFFIIFDEKFVFKVSVFSPPPKKKFPFRGYETSPRIEVR